MLFRHLIAACLSVIPFVFFAQQNELLESMKSISAMVGEVQVGDESMLQEWSYDEEHPYRVTLHQEEVDKKGRRTDLLYLFNLADMDDRQVLRETSREKMFVKLRADRKLPAIKHFEEGEQKNYEEEVLIQVDGPDEADALIDAFKAAIPLAEKVDQARIVAGSYEEMLSLLEESVMDVTVNDEVVRQSLSVSDGDLPLADLVVEEPRGSDIRTTESRINLGDLSEQVRYDVKGDRVFVELETRGKVRYIGQLVDGEPDDYTGSVEILAEDMEKARDLSKILEILIPQALDRLRGSLPALESGEDALHALGKLVGEVSIEEETYGQEILPECQTELTVIESDDKGSETRVYRMHIGDLQGEQAEVKVRGNRIEVEVPTRAGLRMIREEENGEFRQFTDDLTLVAADVENAREILHVFPALTDWCNDNRVRLAPEGDLAGALEWIAREVAAYNGDEGELRQTLTWETDNLCSVFLEIDEGKKPEAYEFRLQDLEQRFIELDISSRALMVELRTQGGEDLIKYYSDGELKKYTDQVEFQLGDLTIGSEVVQLLREAVQKCGEE